MISASTFFPNILLLYINFHICINIHYVGKIYTSVMLGLWKESYDKPRKHIKKQRHYFADKGPSSQGYGFFSSHVRMWELDHKEGWTLKNWCFWTVVLGKTFESPLDCKEIKWVSSVQFSRSVMSNSLWPHESQHARPPCPSPTPEIYPNSCPSSRWCHPAISSSVVPFSSCPQSFPESGSFTMSQLFAWGSQSIGVSASASVLPMNTQDWSPLG